MIKSKVKTKEGTKSITAYTYDEVKLPIVKFSDVQRNHKMIKYSNTFATLDTETSHAGECDAWVYQWAVKFGGTYIYGRKPSEIIELLIRMAERYELTENKRIIIYIHNAAYDLQYLKHYLHQYDASMKYFATDAHTVLICDILGFRILCSYRLTNLSLDALSKNYASTYVKATGTIDYNIRRYQDSDLAEDDWYYMFSDVASQYDGIRGYLKANGYNRAADAPITSTGFVRMDCRRAARKVKTWRDDFVKMQLTPEQYKLCRAAFMGGLTIASYKYAGQTIRWVNIGHVDFTSSYPARQCIDYFPVSAPEWYGEIDDEEELEELLNTKCCVFILSLDNVQIRAGVTAPCIPSSKCIVKRGDVRVNGKIVFAEHIEIAVCEIDYYWITKQYTAEKKSVSHMLTFERGFLPDWFRGKVMEYFRDKCTLKNTNPLLYMKQKNRLNGIYGMTATAVCREVYELDDDLILGRAEMTPEERNEKDAEQIRKYYNNYNSFLPYQWSIYTTAHSRAALLSLVETIGYDNFLYCDTDSEFFIETPENRARLDAHNQYLINRAKAAGAYVGDKYLGAAEDEAPIRAFRALHAKCYAAEEQTKTGEYALNVVIAGVPKKTTKWIDGKPVTVSNADELQSIDNLDEGFVFRHNGGTRTIYNEQMPEIKDIDEHITEIASSAVICDIEKEISDTMFSYGQNYEMLNIVQDQQ